MNVTLADLLPLVEESAIIVSTEDRYIICWDYTSIECHYDNEESREADRKVTRKVLAPYMDRKVKAIYGSYDGQNIVIYGRKVDQDGN